MNGFVEELSKQLSCYNLTGASFAYWDGTRLHTAVAGCRNSRTRDPVTEDTVMHIGSIAKVMNAALVMQLVEEGLIDLDQPVAAAFPGFRVRDPDATLKITPRMLINHTSGINGDWLPQGDPDQERIEDAVQRSQLLGQLYAPGDAVSYCNIATVIAGYLVQRIRNQSWYGILNERIFEPLGLSCAVADIAQTPLFRCSVGDLTDLGTGAAFQTSRPFLSPSFAPAGSTIMMSASDLVQFGRTMVNGGLAPNGNRILSLASTKLMEKSDRQFASPAYGNGLGWMTTPTGLLTHSGAGPGVCSYLFAEAANGRVLALLTNNDRGNLLKASFLDPLLDQCQVTSPPVHQSRPALVDCSRYVGRYANNIVDIDVSEGDDGLFWRQTVKLPLFDNSPFGPLAHMAPRLKLTSTGPDTFCSDPALLGGAPGEVKFVAPDPKGRMQFLGTGFRLLERI